MQLPEGIFRTKKRKNDQTEASNCLPLRIAELLLMISTRLTCTERLGNGEHVLLFKESSRCGFHSGFELLVLNRRLLRWCWFSPRAARPERVICSNRRRHPDRFL